MLPELTPKELERYNRHIVMEEIGEAGQRKLKAARVLIIGTGGLGSAIALYLAAAGIGKIGLVDADLVDSSNLQRQVIHGTSRIGERKVLSAKTRMEDINPHIKVVTYPEHFTIRNAEAITRDYGILIDGTDNYAARYLINDIAVLSDKPYVYGAVAGFRGQISVLGTREGPCLRCLFPQSPTAESLPPHNGIIGVLPGTIGTLQATETLKLILGIGEPLINKLMLFDALEMDFQTIELRKNPHCLICGTEPIITDISPRKEYNNAL
jgi:adenylyltransferase/sulfurtransferase